MHDKLNGSYRHVPNLLIVDKICNLCVNVTDVDYVCVLCSQRRHIFESVNCVKLFIDFLMEHNPKYNSKQPRISIIAHNFSGFDGQFVMRTLLERQDTEISVIMRGMKILKLTLLNRFTFIDLLNFLPMALSKFPKTFGI